MYDFIEEFVDNAIAFNPAWDGDLIDLTDEHKDAITLAWLNHRFTWHSDIFPSVLVNTRSALRALYSDDDGAFSRMISDDIKSDLKQRTSNVNVHLQDFMDDWMFSEATDYFANEFMILPPADFDRWYRDSVYLYLESNLRELIQDQYNVCAGIDSELFAGYERGQ
tara:strand:- start:281 stop:778 length:498 start_codon:yes stop_codon:yes gene_type:complete